LALPAFVDLAEAPMRIRARLLSALAFAATALGLAAHAPKGRAQAAEDISVETYDGVKLRGRQYASSGKIKSNPVVILLHGYQKEPTKGDWSGLAEKLASAGYHVAQFDFRFHGQKPTEVLPASFWKENVNAKYVTGATKKPPRDELTLKDVRNAKDYYPMLVNDVMAVRTYLDIQNDTGRVNTSNVYLIGAGDAASVGFLYMAAEWYREREVPNIGIPPVLVAANRAPFLNAPSCGKDLAGAIWLSPARHPSMSTSTVENLTSKYAPQMREETPMLFLHGEKDTKGRDGAKFFYDRVLIAQPKPGARVAKLPQTKLEVIKGTQLAEADLLGKNLGTEDQIMKFLEETEKARKSGPPLPRRGYTRPLPVVYTSFGLNP
jgi:hypothetical protein